MSLEDISKSKHHDAQNELGEMLRDEALKNDIHPIYAEKLSFLFRESNIVPSLKHPRQFIMHIHGRLKLSRKVDNKALIKLVDQGLSMDREYWNAAKVWGNSVPTFRNAFSNKESILKKMNAKFK